jgi:hypothetical protein
MLPALDNFVSYGNDVFNARADYRQMVLDIYLTAMAANELGEQDRVNACKLAESMLLNLRGHIDDVRVVFRGLLFLSRLLDAPFEGIASHHCHRA